MDMLLLIADLAILVWYSLITLLRLTPSQAFKRRNSILVSHDSTGSNGTQGNWFPAKLIGFNIYLVPRSMGQRKLMVFHMACNFNHSGVTCIVSGDWPKLDGI